MDLYQLVSQCLIITCVLIVLLKQLLPNRPDYEIVGLSAGSALTLCVATKMVTQSTSKPQLKTRPRMEARVESEARGEPKAVEEAVAEKALEEFPSVNGVETMTNVSNDDVAAYDPHPTLAGYEGTQFEPVSNFDNTNKYKELMKHVEQTQQHTRATVKDSLFTPSGKNQGPLRPMNMMGADLPVNMDLVQGRAEGPFEQVYAPF